MSRIATVHPATPANIATAAHILRYGGLVALPTETVYGLGADATQGEAVARIYESKGRPAFNPLIVHVADAAWVDDLAETNTHFHALARAFWPGPLTLILKRKDTCPVSKLVCAGLDSIALRMPNHPVALDLLRALGSPLAAPSANASGMLSPTRAEHVTGLTRVDMVLDGGPCREGLESTVVDLTSERPAILRPGPVTSAMLTAVIGQLGVAGSGVMKSPGQLASHYAPRLPLRMNATRPEKTEAWLGFGPSDGATLNLSATGDLVEAAAHLFDYLYQLDDPERFAAIAVAPVPEEGLGAAINDRLRRAATRV